MRSSDSYIQNVAEISDDHDHDHEEQLIESFWNEVGIYKQMLSQMALKAREHDAFKELEYRHSIQIIDEIEDDYILISTEEYEDYQRLLSAELAAKREEEV